VRVRLADRHRPQVNSGCAYGLFNMNFVFLLQMPKAPLHMLKESFLFGQQRHVNRMSGISDSENLR
jgi:hypothetical protein